MSVSRYAFLLKPRWIAFHLLCITLMVATVNLGLWQWSRHHDKRAARDLVETRTEQPVVPLGDVLAATDGAGVVDDVRFSPVTARGIYDWAAEVLVRSRTLEGRTGYWVLTPLVVEGTDAAVVVNRGWVPLDVPDQRPLPDTRPPAGTVEVAGYLEEGQTRGAFGPRDPAEGTLTELVRADLERIQQQYPRDLYPGILQLATQQPAQVDGFPTPLPLPSADLGPHLSYAAQWAIFTLLVPVGWLLVVRQSVKRRTRAETSTAGDPPDDDPHVLSA